MYVPAHFAPDAALVDELLRNHGAADLVTLTERGLVATMLPFIYVPPEDRDPDGSSPDHPSTDHSSTGGPRSAGQPGALHGHLARNNDQWRLGSAGEALAIVRGPDAYITPGWYASTAEHGRVVPTWNYLTAHVYGRLVVHDDPVWTEDLVRRLTAKHEAYRDHPRSVDDAPRAFVEGQLRAIVGVELQITRIEAKAKLSQNRPPADVEGVIAGLRERGDQESADAVERARRLLRQAGQGRPYDLARGTVSGRAPAEPAAHGLDQKQSAAVLVIVADIPRLRGAGAVVADEDGQFPPAEREDQPDEGVIHPLGGKHRVGGQLRHNDLGRLDQAGQPPFRQDLAGPGAGTARRRGQGAQVEHRPRRPACRRARRAGVVPYGAASGCGAGGHRGPPSWWPSLVCFRQDQRSPISIAPGHTGDTKAYFQLAGMPG
jgi:transcriptional regulator